MKEFTEDELITMAYSEVKKMEINFYTQMILCVLCLIESTLLFFGLISITTFVVFWPLFIGLYLLHNKKSKKSEIKIQEIIDELTSRGI
jgi:hypothetical protein